MELAVILVIFGCIFSLAMASWIPSTKLEVTKQNDTDEVGTRASNYPIIFITRVRVISGIKRTGTRVFTGSRFYTLNLRYFGINFQKYFFKLYFKHNCHHFNSNNHDTRYFWLKYPIIVDNLSKFA